MNSVTAYGLYSYVIPWSQRDTSGPPTRQSGTLQASHVVQNGTLRAPVDPSRESQVHGAAGHAPHALSGGPVRGDAVHQLAERLHVDGATRHNPPGRPRPPEPLSVVIVDHHPVAQ